jgi:general secretion pathway protein A
MSQVHHHESDAEIVELINDGGTKPGRAAIHEDSALPIKHFKLSSHPFSDSVNPNYFFRTEAHEEAFLAMKQCIEDNVALGLTTAISGTGKTLLTQVLLQGLDPRKYQAILVLAYPGMSRTALLRELLSELKAEKVPERGGVHQLVSAIQQHIIQQYIRGIRLVVIIDEVHFLSADALHVLRTLSNIEFPDHKLVTVLLFGENSFLTKMKNAAFRSVFSRMFTRLELRPLHRHEVEQYVKYRLLVAGGRPNLIAASAFDPLFERSHGIPREINRICHNALALAAKEGKSELDGSLIARIPPAAPLEKI